MTWISAARTAAAETAAFFEAHPVAYEETLDHVLIHNLETALAGVTGARIVARFAGRAGQVYFPGFTKRCEVVDLVLILRTSRVTKIALLQSKRIFPKRKGLTLPKSSPTMLDELNAYVHAELTTPPAIFRADSTYESVQKTTKGKTVAQWDAIEKINNSSQATWGGRDAVHYLLYHPVDPAYFGLASRPSGGQLGIRVVSQTQLAAGIGPTARSLKPAQLSAVFADPLTTFSGFLAHSARCGVTIPVDRRTKRAMTVLLPGIRYDLPASRTDKLEKRNPLSIIADRSEHPVLDLRATNVVTLIVDGDEQSWLDDGA